METLSPPLPRVCVTGGGGFIGSWLVKLLLSRGYAVHATVRDPRTQLSCTDGTAATASTAQFLHLCSSSRCMLSLAGDAKVAFLTQLDGALENLRLFKADMLDYDTVTAAFAGCERASSMSPLRCPNTRWLVHRQARVHSLESTELKLSRRLKVS
jgi:nucleoside-diphosphate-sugar epimerase